MLFTPEELGWLATFTALLINLAPQRKWKELLNQLVMIGPDVPNRCRCEKAWEFESGVHQNHAEYNRRLRAAIVSYEAREGMHDAAYRDMKRSPPPKGEEDYKKISSNEYAPLILDFLRDKPRLPWFKDPVPVGRMYQGDALANQESNPGLSN